MKKLAIITTHPIQYNAPFFRMLYARQNIEPKIFYTWSQSASGVKYDPGFKKDIEWDIPLTEGYPFVFSENISTEPGSHHAKGIDNPFLAEQIEAWKPEAVLVYGWNFKSHGKLMRYFHDRVPVIFRGDSTLLDERPGIKKILRRLWLRRIFSSVDMALYAGKANKDYFRAHGIKEKNLIFMPHAIENSRFAPNEETKKKAVLLRQELNIPLEAIVFLFAGKLEEKKQPGLLAKALESIHETDAWLVIAGSGELRDELKARFEQNQHIRFLDFQNQQQMPALYASCDVFILPSKGPGETWGLALNEAMAAGKAVMATDRCGGSYDLIRPGENGFVFKSNGQKELEQYISMFVKNRDLAKQMGERSADLIKAYSYEKDCIAVEDVVLNLINTKKL